MLSQQPLVSVLMLSTKTGSVLLPQLVFRKSQSLFFPQALLKLPVLRTLETSVQPVSVAVPLGPANPSAQRVRNAGHAGQCIHM